jgi:hypothetical protein
VTVVYGLVGALEGCEKCCTESFAKTAQDAARIVIPHHHRQPHPRKCIEATMHSTMMPNACPYGTHALTDASSATLLWSPRANCASISGHAFRNYWPFDSGRSCLHTA